MSSSTDLLQAKQTLSARFLRAGLRGNAVRRRATRSVREAMAYAGQNVHAVGLGPKIVNGLPTEDMCVRLYVIQKIAPSLLPPRDRLPETIDGIPTDVIESPPAFISARGRRRAGANERGRAAEAASCTNSRKMKQRPLIGGISSAHFDVTAGTIGYFCRSVLHGDNPSKVYVLSNNHILADLNQAEEGDDLYQPGTADGGTFNERVARLHRFVPLILGGIIPNRVDAAIGELLSGIQHRPEVCGIGSITGTTRATLDMKVTKHGRTTGLTEGMVFDISYDSLIEMDRNTGVAALFQDQIRVQRTPPFSEFALEGDSGSLVINKSTLEAVGLLFAYSDGGEYGVSNHIADVLTDLQVELL